MGCAWRQARLEDHRRLLAAQESEADERERLRMQIRALLEARVRFARSAEGTLRALGIPMEYDPVTRMPDINKAVRRALRFYHPDRYQVSCQCTPALLLLCCGREGFVAAQSVYWSPQSFDG